jgi:hypothetical protein
VDELRDPMPKIKERTKVLFLALNIIFDKYILIRWFCSIVFLTRTLFLLRRNIILVDSGFAYFPG